MHPSYWLLYGDPGSGKSSAAATWPKPMLVLMLDQPGKDTPYLLGPDRLVLPWTERRDQFGSRIVEAGGVTIEHYNNLSPSSNAMECLKWRLQQRAFVDEGYKTLVLDSVTFLELALRKALTARGVPDKQLPIAVTNDVEDVLLILLSGLPINVIVTAHVETKKDEVNGVLLRQVAAPGRLHSRSMLAAAFAELYRTYVSPSGEYLFQTRADANFNAASQIDAPNPCAQRYAAVWREEK